MFWWKPAVATLLFCSSSLAAPRVEQNTRTNFDRRDDTNNGPAALLEPVIPSNVNTGNITILGLGKAVTLAWAGSANGTAARRLGRRDGSAPPLLKRDGAVSSQADFTFQYPAITLDHSTYVSNVACPASGTLTGVLTSTAYTYAKSRWPSAGKILFVTSVDGCGLDDQNHLFLSKSVTFNDKTKSFTAKGAPSTYKATGVHMNLQWGNLPATTKIRRAADKSEMFEPHHLERRRTSLGISWDLTLSRFANAQQFAPWDDAIMLANWTKQGGKEDGSWSKGEVSSPTGHHKRSSNDTSLELRKTLDEREVASKYQYGLGLYCVDCGFTGSATVWGELDITIGGKVNTAQAGFDASFAFDINLGMAAFVVYKKEWDKMLEKVELEGFKIPFICDIGLFVQLDLTAELEISATGTLLLGAGIHYDSIGFVIDFLNSANSHSTTLPPRFQHRAEATGQVKIGASLGMPIRLGLGVGVLDDFWSADAAIIDTPSINIEAEFALSATVTDDGKIETNVNGGCHGIAWNIFFQNLIQLELKADDIADYTIDLFRPFKTDPLAEDCIGYVQDGADGTDDSPAGGAGGNGLSGNQPGVIGNPTATSKGAASATSISGCKPSQIVDNFSAATSSGATCKKIVTSATVSKSNNVGKDQIGTDVNTCADACLKEPKCLSWSLSDKGVGGRGTCQKYVKKVSSIGIVTKDSTTLTFYDKSCWKYSNCKV